MPVIDYALVRHIDVVSCDVVNAGDSDHLAVVYVVRQRHAFAHRRRVLRVGVWNVEHRRDDRTVAGEVAQLLHDQALDALLLCEAGEYLPRLAELPEHRLHAWHEAGAAETCILVRRKLRQGGGWCHPMGRAVFNTWRGVPTRPKYLPTVLVDGWLRLAAAHTPPGVTWRWSRLAGRPVPRGGPLRVAAYVDWMRHARRFVGRRVAGQALFLAGDWNAEPGDAGAWSPAWLAAVTGLRIVAPTTGTHR